MSVHVVIAGGGFAGLEAVLALRALAPRVRITLVTNTGVMLERPTTVAEPFDRAVAPSHDVDAFARDQRIEVAFDRVVAVDADDHAVELAGGRRLDYDRLVIATGAQTVAALPDALQFRGPRDVETMRAVLNDLRSGAARSVAFVLPAAATWSLPLYELALMTGAELRADGVEGMAVTLVTPEPAPLAIFGDAAPAALRPVLDARGVTVVTGVGAARVQDGRLVLDDGRTVAADRVVALAAIVGRPPIGLPSDGAGVGPVDDHGRVAGLTDVFAAGDVTDGPVKQGGLATQQADAVAEAIAGELGLVASPRPYRPVIRGLLLVGGAPLYLRADLREGETAAELLPGASAASSSALWWPPAKVAGRYLAPYLATARPSVLGESELADRPAPPARSSAAAAAPDHDEAVALALELAEADARIGDYDAAVRALDAARSVAGGLTPEYERKRDRWLQSR